LCFFTRQQPIRAAPFSRFPKTPHAPSVFQSGFPGLSGA
jgi:hypothetical protein